MIKITKKQMEKFDRAVWHHFEDRLLEHYEEHYPDHVDLLGEDQMRRFFRHGFARAERHGFVTERDICIYLSVMFVLGSRFDEDIQYPWAAEIIDDDTIATPSEKVDKLHERTMEYIDDVVGEDNEIYKKTLHILRHDPIRDLEQCDPHHFEYAMHKLLRKIWWRKCEYLGDDILSNLIRSGIKTGRAYHISDVCGTGLFITLMFMLGSHFHRDPKYPWATSILRGATSTSGTSLVQELRDASEDYLHTWIVIMDEEE